jgi:UDP-N-acetylmuramoylalanine--D-glutamate ligase
LAEKSLKEILFRSGPETPDDLEGLRVTVMGLGLFGGGAGVTRFLASRGALVTVTDLRDAALLEKSLDLLDGLPVRFALGRHDLRDFTGADLVVANPAVPPGSPFLEAAAARGVPVDSEINMTFRFLPARQIVGVTGSNGKTTTSHLLQSMVQACGRKAWLGGNTGGSLLTGLDRIGRDDVVVLELSSFQLEMTGAAGLGPDVAVITNITPNHLDRHGTFGAYVAAKKKILIRARRAVFNAGDRLTSDLAGAFGPAGSMLFSSRRALDAGLYLDGDLLRQARRNRSGSGCRSRIVSSIRDFTLPGIFNAENIMAALAATCHVLGVDDVPPEAVRAGAAFRGVSHRLETVDHVGGVRYVNDSIATTPESTAAALSALDGEIALIAGGYDKGIPLEGLAEAIRERVSILYLIGETAGKVAEAVRKRGEGGGPRLVRADGVEEAVEIASRTVGNGWTVLLSPAFASYDQFINFEERGACFRRSVARLKERESPPARGEKR